MRKTRFWRDAVPRPWTCMDAWTLVEKLFRIICKLVFSITKLKGKRK